MQHVRNTRPASRANRLISKAVLLVAALAIVVLGAPSPVGAHHGGDNQTWGSVFTLFCDASHRNNDDPIKFPGQQGAAHLHQYFGSKVMDFNVTEAEAEAGDSTCRLKKDTAGYWVPALLNSSGQPVTPTNVYFYYYCQPVSASCVTGRSIPDDLKVIWGTSVGDPLNNTGAGGAFAPAGGFRCGTGGNNFYNHIVDCSQGIKIELSAPPCWDGVNLDSPNHRSHMSYMVSQACPASHPVKLPMPTYFVQWPSITNGASGGYELSSDGVATPGSTAHADFWNTWDQPTLDRIGTSCTIDHVDVPESNNDWGCRLLDSQVWTAQTAPIDYGLITNGGFETGSLSGWTVAPAGAVVVQTTTKNTGTYAARLNGQTSASVTVTQTFSATPGETVCVSGNIWADASYAAGQARLEIKGVSSPWPFVAISPSSTGTNGGGLGAGEFKHVWAQGTVPAGQTSVNVRFLAPPEADGSGFITMDDISFTRAACPNPSSGEEPAPNIVLNPGFESGLTSWDTPDPGASAVTSPVHSGSKSLQIAAGSDETRDVRQTINVTAGTSYLVSGWVKTETLSGGADVRIEWRNSSGAAISTVLVGTTLTGTNDWMFRSATLVAPVGAVTAYYRLRTIVEPDNAGKGWFDDLSVSVS